MTTSLKGMLPNDICHLDHWLTGGEVKLRIWDLPVSAPCDAHLWGEHNELHFIWSILTEGKVMYTTHPEVIRWRGKLSALAKRHHEQESEMENRGFTHLSPLSSCCSDSEEQDLIIDPLERQKEILRSKPCDCRVRG